MKVRITRQAQSDLLGIRDWIAADNPFRAESFVRELYDRCLSLADQPHRFPVVRTINGRALRKLTHGNYLIFYFELDASVRIARVAHGSRDWQSILDRFE
mgnify:CR=1 FL=1